MKKLDPTAASQFTSEWLEQEMKNQLAVETDIARKRLITTFFTRQKKAFECLNLIQADEPQKKQQLALNDQEKWLQILLHPAANLVLPVIILVLALFRLFIPTVVFCVLLLVRAVLLLLVKPEGRSAQPRKATPYVDDDALSGFLRDQRNAITIDVDSIMSQFATVNVKEQKTITGDLVSVYLSLFETKVDAPDNEDLSYPLSVLKTCLHRSGLEVVRYSPENAALFDVMDVDYPSQERTPAIRSLENGVIVKKGLYLNEKK